MHTERGDTAAVALASGHTCRQLLLAAWHREWVLGQPPARPATRPLQHVHAGDEAPRFVEPTVLGYPKAVPGAGRGPLADMDYVVGSAALAQSSAGMALSYPMKGGIISDFDACEGMQGEAQGGSGPSEGTQPLGSACAAVLTGRACPARHVALLCSQHVLPCCCTTCAPSGLQGRRSCIA